MLSKVVARSVGIAALTLSLWAGGASADPKIVTGPGADPACFKPWDANTKYFQWPARQGPYRIALVNGFVGNVWRIQMIKTAKAYASLPDVAKDIKEFKQGNRVKPIKSFLRTAITLWVMSARRSVLLSESRLENRST